MTDFYLILSNNKVKYGLLFADEQQIKPYEIGHLPEYFNPILQIGMYKLAYLDYKIPAKLPQKPMMSQCHFKR